MLNQHLHSGSVPPRLCITLHFLCLTQPPKPPCFYKAEAETSCILPTAPATPQMLPPPLLHPAERDIDPTQPTHFPAQWPEPPDVATARCGGVPGHPVPSFRVGSAVPLPAVSWRCGRQGRTWQPPRQAEFALPAWLSSCTPFAGVHLPWLPPDMPEHTAASRLRLSGLCFLLQILNILLFAVFARYSPESSPSHCPPQLDCSQRNQDSGFQQPREYPQARGCRAVLLRGWHGVSPCSVQAADLSQTPESGREHRAAGLGYWCIPEGVKQTCFTRLLKCLDRASPKRGIFGLGHVLEQLELRGDH